MLPSLLAKDIQTGLKQFLVAGFEPAAPFLGQRGRYPLGQRGRHPFSAIPHRSTKPA